MKRANPIQPPRASISVRTRFSSARLCAASSGVSAGSRPVCSRSGARAGDSLRGVGYRRRRPREVGAAGRIRRMHADRPLDGRCILVTGAARRLGAAIARRLHAAGASIVVHHRRSAAEATALAAESNAARPGSAITAACDLKDLDALPALVESALQRYGRLDAPSTTPRPSIPHRSAASRRPSGTTCSALICAPFFLSQAAVPALRTAHGLIPTCSTSMASGRSRASDLQRCEGWARDAHPFPRPGARSRIRVNGIAPGPDSGPKADSPTL